MPLFKALTRIIHPLIEILCLFIHPSCRCKPVYCC